MDYGFSFYYENELLKNQVSVYLDDMEMGHCMWCGGNGIWELIDPKPISQKSEIRS